MGCAGWTTLTPASLLLSCSRRSAPSMPAIPVPVLLAPTLGGLAHGTALHYVLITGHSDGKLSVYDPEGGRITQVPDGDFLAGNMQAIDAGAPHVNAVIMPG